MKTMIFLSGVSTGFALFALFHYYFIEDTMAEDWKWRLEQEQAAHLETSKELQRLRSSIAAGLNLKF